MPQVAVDNRSIDFQRRGAGARLLLIQGMAGHHGLWGEALLGALEQGFDVLTYDHRGVGHSTDVADEDFTIRDLANDALAVLDAVGWSDANVLGISMGGMVAQELVLQHPERVNALMLGCTYCGGPGSTLQAPGPLRMLQAMTAGNVDAALRTAFTSNLSAGFAADESRYELFKTASLSVRVPVPVVVRQARAAFAHNTSERLPGIAAPTLVLHGTADEMLDHVNGEVISALIPNARLHSYDGAGHLFWWEQPDVTAALIREHCDA